MPIPFILGAAAAIAGIAGVGAGIHGAVKMKEANDTMKSTQARHKKNCERFEEQNKQTSEMMDHLGKLELDILVSFQKFSDTFEKLQNRPHFKEYTREGVSLPQYNSEELKRVYVGAGVLLGGLGGAALGTAGGFAAAGATTAAVMALGTASTGTAIASLSGAAAVNATLAALGGGAVAAGGGGMALGSMILGASTLGVGLLIGGVIFNFTGEKLSEKADEAWSQMMIAEQDINRICNYLKELSATANDYFMTLGRVNDIYQKHLNWMDLEVNTYGRQDWLKFTNEEQMRIENTVLLVALLYKMCQVKLVEKSKTENGMNTINKQATQDSIQEAELFLESKNLEM